MIDVLLIDRDPHTRATTLQTLAAARLTSAAADSAEEALSWLCADFGGVVLAETGSLGSCGMAVLEAAMRADRALPIVLLAASQDVALTLEAGRRGACVVAKPVRAHELIDILQRVQGKRQSMAEQHASHQSADAPELPVLLGESPAIQTLRRFVDTMGPAQVDILILGDTGTGKEVVARRLHAARSPDAPFVAIDCTALPEHLFDTEVFGREPRATLQETEHRPGKFELAGRGTLFIDEIEAMPLVHQAALLQVLEARSIESGGDGAPIGVDCRVVVASKADLVQLSRKGHFHAGLCERLVRASVRLPALREHLDDMPLLLGHFVRQACLRYDRPVPEWTPSLIANWTARPWPGNVRELKAFADQLVLGLSDEQTVDAEPEAMLPLPRQVELFERRLLREALDCTDGNVIQAADRLGISRSTFYDKLKRYQMAL